MAPPFIPLPQPVAPPRRLLYGLFTVHLFWVYIALAQRSSVSFGPVAEYSLWRTPSTVLVLSPTPASPMQLAVGFADAPGISLVSVPDSGIMQAAGTLRTSLPAASLLAADLDADRQEEIVLLAADGQHVCILKRRGTSVSESVFGLNARADRMAIADINSDGKNDVLLFGKTTAGIETLLGSSRGRFEPGPTLFPEVSVTDLVAEDYNGDRITDIVMLDWLSNRLLVHFGIGHGIFSEQVKLNLPGEPGRLALVRANQRRTLDVVVTLPFEKALVHITGTPAGDFVLRKTIKLRSRPTGVRLARVNQDPYPDLVCSTASGILVAMGESSFSFSELQPFGVGAEATSFAIADIDRDGAADLVIADRAGRSILALSNAAGRSAARWPPVYAVGLRPSGLSAVDINGDGHPDLAVANAGSATLSLLLNNGEGRFGGQYAFRVPEHPTAVRLAPIKSSSRRTLVSTHPGEDLLGVVRMNADLQRARQFSIPTATNPEVLFVDAKDEGDRLSILVRYGNQRGNPAIGYLEQIAGRQFLEHTFRPSLDGVVTAIAVGDYTGNLRKDLLLGTRNKAAQEVGIALAPSIAGYDFQRIQPLFRLADSVASVKALVAADVDNDGLLDAVILLGPPSYALGIAFGESDRGLTPPLSWISPVRPVEESDAIQAEDVDGDGRKDIVVLDEAREAIVCCYGLPGRRLSAPALIAPARGVRHFAAAALTSSGTHDLILSEEHRHVITVRPGAFAR